MYASVRSYRIRTGNIDELLRRIDHEFTPQVAELPGFVSYLVLDKGDRIVASVTVCQNREALDRSNEMAAAWVADRLAEFDVAPLGVIAGEAKVIRTAGGLPTP